MLENRKVLLAGIEGTYNVDPTLTGTDAVLVEDLNWSNNGLRMVERPALRANIGKLKQIYAGRLVDIAFTAEIKGSGTAGTTPELGALLRACGFDETVVASTSVTYAPVSEGHESVTMYLYRDGKRIIVTGCRGNVSFGLESGSVGKASFTMTGHVAAETDESMVTPSYDSTVPSELIGVPFSIGSYSAVISTLNFDMSNTIATPPDMSASDGYAAVQITARDVNGSFNPEDTLVASKDWLGIFTGGTDQALDTGAIGGTAGNIYQVTMPATYFRDVSAADRDGVSVLDIPFGAVESSGDDEVSIAFT